MVYKVAYMSKSHPLTKVERWDWKGLEKASKWIRSEDLP